MREHIPYEAPAGNEKGQVATSFEVLDNPVRWYVNENVRHIEDDEGDVELGPFHAQVLGQPIDSGVSYVGAVDEREAIESGTHPSEVFLLLTARLRRAMGLCAGRIFVRLSC